MPTRSRTLALIAAQITVFWCLAQLGDRVAAATHLPLPGAITGMIAVLALLWSGLVRLEGFAAGGDALVAHIGLFFAPIVVGAVDLAGTLGATAGVLLAIVVASAAVGIAFSGLVAHRT